MASWEGLHFEFHGGVHVAVYPPGATFGPRELGDFEFVWIIAGDATLTCDGTSYPMPPGAVSLCRPGMRDSFIWDKKAWSQHGFIHFHIKNYEARMCRDWPVVRYPAGNDILRPLFHHVAWLLDNKAPGHEALAQNAMRQALGTFITGHWNTATDGGRDPDPAIERMMDFVQRSWADDAITAIPLDALARAAKVSRGHLVRLFRQSFGMGPVEALRMLRLERAASMLARTNLKIQHIAKQCGFDSAFHFSRLFHEVYGHSPRAFRKRLADGMTMPMIALARTRVLSARIWNT